RFFKNMIGISFNRYVINYRLSHACYLLNNTDSSIINCAIDSGFYSIRTFNRNFKTQYGITPEEYRKQK
ncbi:MAG: AraC family transcriptional regulator, partial [Clostridia bacterium]|nr:AraC family transcriptional regulator [Clostridia bacterium]